MALTLFLQFVAAATRTNDRIDWQKKVKRSEDSGGGGMYHLQQQQPRKMHISGNMRGSVREAKGVLNVSSGRGGREGGECRCA